MPHMSKGCRTYRLVQARSGCLGSCSSESHAAKNARLRGVNDRRAVAGPRHLLRERNTGVCPKAKEGRAESTDVDVLNQPLVTVVPKLELPLPALNAHRFCSNLRDISKDPWARRIGVRPCDADAALLQLQLLFVHAAEGPAQRSLVHARPHGFRLFNIESHERVEVTTDESLNRSDVRCAHDWS